MSQYTCSRTLLLYSVISTFDLSMEIFKYFASPRPDNEWHLTPHIGYISKPVLGGHPVLSGHYSIPRGCPLNTGFTVLQNVTGQK